MTVVDRRGPRRARIWPALVVFVLGLFVARLATAQDPAKPACTVCTAGAIACPTCAGAGTVAVACVFCEGDGAIECRACAKGKPGTADCPNRTCRDGRTQWDTGMSDPCKLCVAKGTIVCAACRGKKTTRCVACLGAGKRLRTCVTCAGAARLPCPACVADPKSASCAPCGGSGQWSCRRCTDKKPAPKTACIACNGAGGFACITCSGLDRVACENCGASGRMRMAAKTAPGLGGVPGAKAGVKECDRCTGAGIRNCPDCKGGTRDCAECERGVVAKGCLACLQVGNLPCDDCLSGNLARRQAMGDFLLAAGHPAAAIPWLESTLARARDFAGPSGPAAPLATKALLDAWRLDPRLEVLLPLPFAVPSRALVSERAIPHDRRVQLWPDPPKDGKPLPWLDATWLAEHRQRHVARLGEALGKAREAAAVGK